MEQVPDFLGSVMKGYWLLLEKKFEMKDIFPFPVTHSLTVPKLYIKIHVLYFTIKDMLLSTYSSLRTPFRPYLLGNRSL